MSHTEWIDYFTRNQQIRPEPEWAASVSLGPKMLAPRVRSMEQFRLGDGGGPASLIAHDAEKFRGCMEQMRQMMDLCSLCGSAAGTMLWVNPAPCLKAIGGTHTEFYSEMTRHLTCFLRSLRRTGGSRRVPARGPTPPTQLQLAK
jgi:hypothetical protein